MAFRTLDQADLSGKRALVRVDFNVPMQDGEISDDTRLRAALPTIDELRDGGAKVILISHFDRPKGKRVPSMSLKPAGRAAGEADRRAGGLRRRLRRRDRRAGRGLSASRAACCCWRTCAIHAGEEANDPAFAKQLAALGDLYVDDAFSAAHRAHASTEGVAHLLPAYAGESHAAGADGAGPALGHPERPVLGIVGGSKVSSKLDLLRHLVTKLDKLAIGGGMANTFLFAQGWDVGASYCEKELAETAREIMAFAGRSNCELLLPIDIVVAEKAAPARRRGCGGWARSTTHERILDAGPETVARLERAMDNSKTLIWNGPLGVFEIPPFDRGTMEAAKHAAALAKAGKLVAVAGGGDTVSALHAAGVAGDFTFVSTAGGAFLEWMEGKTLPGVAGSGQIGAALPIKRRL